MNLSDLQTLLDANPGVDFRQLALDGPISTTLRLDGVSAESALQVLSAYQRILRILPATEDHRALPLLSIGVHSAIQIANVSEGEFTRHWTKLFPADEALGLKVYRAARSRRSTLLHQHLNTIQRNEPHYRSARFK